MAVLPIRILGDPVLATPAAPVEAITDDIHALIHDLFDTMDAAPGVGLAAPQVGISLRVFVYSYQDDSGAPWRGAVLNPRLWLRPVAPGQPDPDTESEGCLSFPGERFPLRRSDHVLLRGTDPDGVPVEFEASGWRARILQHEYDHLDGVLYLDRLNLADQRVAARIARKRGWGSPGATWLPGRDLLEA